MLPPGTTTTLCPARGRHTRTVVPMQVQKEAVVRRDEMRRSPKLASGAKGGAWLDD